MKEKARQRKEDLGKDTVFFMGGKPWPTSRVESTLARGGKSNTSVEIVGTSMSICRTQVPRPCYSVEADSMIQTLQPPKE